MLAIAVMFQVRKMEKASLMKVAVTDEESARADRVTQGLT